MLRFWEKTVSEFGKNRLRFWDKVVPFWERIGSVCGGELVRFWIGLGQNSSLTVLNAKQLRLSMFGFGFRNLKLGVSKKKSTGGKLEG